MEQKDLIKQLALAVKQSNLPEDLKDGVLLKLSQLNNFKSTSFFLEELYRHQRYINWLIQIPWQAETKDNLDIDAVKRVLDDYHYGLDKVKTRILEYLAVMKLKAQAKQLVRAPVLLLTGLVGTGKTTFADALSEALGRQLVRIPFGGLASSFDLRGRSYFKLEAEPGLVVRSLVKAKVKNPIILLDEIDRVNPSARAEIMGVLVELLDPAQNHAFRDYFIDYPIDLSRVFFIATSNNVENIATAVLDRLEVIEMPSYSDAEKTIIGQKHLLPHIIKQAALPEGIFEIKDDVWPLIIRPIGYEAGVRTLQRILQAMVRQVALRVVRGEKGRFVVTVDNYKEFMPKYL